VADYASTCCQKKWANARKVIRRWKPKIVEGRGLSVVVTTTGLSIWKTAWLQFGKGRLQRIKEDPPRHTCEPSSRTCPNGCWILLIIFLPKTAFPRPVYTTNICHLLIPANVAETVSFYIYYYCYHHHHLLYAGYLYLYSWDKLCP